MHCILTHASSPRPSDPSAPIPDTPPTHSRHKDRISYSHQLFQVDLTQVTTPQAPTAPPTHELEVEFRNARPLLEEAAKEQRGEDNRYLDMVQGLLNNVRESSARLAPLAASRGACGRGLPLNGHRPRGYPGHAADFSLVLVRRHAHPQRQRPLSLSPPETSLTVRWARRVPSSRPPRAPVLSCCTASVFIPPRAPRLRAPAPALHSPSRLA